jgi:PKD repeat protein
MQMTSTEQTFDLGRLRLHGWALLAGLVLLGGLLFPWSGFVQLVVKHKVMTGVFFVWALLAVELAGYFLIRAMRERPATSFEAFAPLFYSASGVPHLVFGYVYLLPANPMATVYMLGALGFVSGVLVLWRQNTNLRALLTGQAFTYSVTVTATVTVVAAAAVFASGWGTRRSLFSDPPTASFVVSSQTTTVGDPIDFDAAGSKARKGQIATYDWDFGDGIWHEVGAPQGAKVTHVYYEPGQYEVMLRVIDDRNEVSGAYSIFIVVAGGPGQGFEGKLTLPGQDVMGMAWGGGRLWVVDARERVLYSQAGLSSSAGSTWIKHELPKEIRWPAGLEWDGQNFWLADGAEFKIYQLAPESFQVLTTLEYPGVIPADLAWDGQYLWAIDEIDSVLYAIDPADGRTVKEIKLDTEIFPRPIGLAWDGIAFWVSDMHYGIRRIDPENGRVLGTMAAPDGGSYPVALAWDSGSQGRGLLLVADHDTRQLYQLRLKAWSREKPRAGEGVRP